MNNILGLFGSIIGSPFGTFLLGVLVCYAVLTLIPQRWTDSLTRQDRLGIVAVFIGIFLAVVGFVPNITFGDILLAVLVLVCVVFGVIWIRRTRKQ